MTKKKKKKKLDIVGVSPRVMINTQLCNTVGDFGPAVHRTKWRPMMDRFLIIALVNSCVKRAIRAHYRLNMRRIINQRMEEEAAVAASGVAHLFGVLLVVVVRVGRRRGHH
jgi:hypothetical protein